MDGGIDLLPPAAGYRLRPHAALALALPVPGSGLAPLLVLRNLDRHEENQRWRPYALRLANCRLLPSISPMN